MALGRDDRAYLEVNGERQQTGRFNPFDGGTAMFKRIAGARLVDEVPLAGFTYVDQTLVPKGTLVADGPQGKVASLASAKSLFDSAVGQTRAEFNRVITGMKQGTIDADNAPFDPRTAEVYFNNTMVPALQLQLDIAERGQAAWGPLANSDPARVEFAFNLLRGLPHNSQVMSDPGQSVKFTPNTRQRNAFVNDLSGDFSTASAYSLDQEAAKERAKMRGSTLASALAANRKRSVGDDDATGLNSAGKRIVGD